jgi:hypothetical protein
MGAYGTFADAYSTISPISGSQSLYLYNNNPKDTSIFANWWISTPGLIDSTLTIEFDFKIRNMPHYSLSYQSLTYRDDANQQKSGWLQYCHFTGWTAPYDWSWNYWEAYYGNIQESAFPAYISEDEVHRLKLVMNFQTERYVGVYYDGEWLSVDDWHGYPSSQGTGATMQFSPPQSFHPVNTLRIGILLDSMGTGATEMWIDNLRVTEIVS